MRTLGKKIEETQELLEHFYPSLEAKDFEKYLRLSLSLETIHDAALQKHAGESVYEQETRQYAENLSQCLGEAEEALRKVRTALILLHNRIGCEEV